MISGGTKDFSKPMNIDFPDVFFQGNLKDFISTPVGYPLRTPALVTGENTGCFIVVGQSNAAAFGIGALYTPTNAAKVDSISINSGQIYQGKDPGPNVNGWQDGSGRSWLYRFADKLITAGKYARVIIIPASMGSAKCENFLPGAVLGDFVGSALARAAAFKIPVNGILWQQGEYDGTVGTPQATYENYLGQIIASSRALGYTGAWFMGKSTLQGNITSTPIRNALAAVVNGTNVFAGADTDTLTGVTNRADGTHFSQTGLDSAAELWKNVIVSNL